MTVSKDDENIAPHVAFKVSAKDLEANFERLKKIIPVSGPYRHRGIDCTTFYFMTPEGHKLEICTWEPYPEDKSLMMGAPGVGIMRVAGSRPRLAERARQRSLIGACAARTS
jgi:hypothetical protein